MHLRRCWKSLVKAQIDLPTGTALVVVDDVGSVVVDVDMVVDDVVRAGLDGAVADTFLGVLCIVVNLVVAFVVVVVDVVL